jgi:hypothetical protein
MVKLVRRGIEPSLPNQPSYVVPNSLFRPGVKLVVHRAPLFPGLLSSSSSGSSALHTTFRRPFSKKQQRSTRTGATTTTAAAADQALWRSSLGQRKRMNGMAKLMARAGKGLSFQLQKPRNGTDGSLSSSSSDDENEENSSLPLFEPLCLWQSPHHDTAATAHNHSGRGLPGVLVQQMRDDEFGITEEITTLCLAPLHMYSKVHVHVPTALAKWLRPHQREGVLFMYQCVMGLKNFKGNGCILADGMFLSSGWINIIVV